ncbi:hypothetical protein [Streptomyces mirabilis]|uniref:hypothetical protein n=1 Tax=Streptomyces mirabilis TaxID=68239 RepID=UPI0034056EF9
MDDQGGEQAPSDNPVASAEEDPWGAFALFAALSRSRLAELPPRALARVLPWAPLGVVDDLIDAQVLGPEHQPWKFRGDETDFRYLLARLAPEQVTDDQARALNWSQRRERDAFLRGVEPQSAPGELYDLLAKVADGDASVLKDLEGLLPRDLVLRLRRIQDGAATGTWDRDILDDRGLWRLVFALWEPKAAVSPARSAMHALMALRQAYDLICSNDLARRVPDSQAGVVRISGTGLQGGSDQLPGLPSAPRRGPGRRRRRAQQHPRLRPHEK